MPVLSGLQSLWRNLVHRGRVERDLDDELNAVFELLVEEKLRGGMRGKDARRAALLELGGVDPIKERVRASRAGAWVDGLRRDVRYAFRVLARGRLFTAVAVLTLALGVGANSAMFGVVNGLLLRPLPYPDADRLVWIVGSIAWADVGDWREGMRSLERAGAFGLRTTIRTGRGAAERVEGMVVTEELLALLGARPVRGRLWTADEHRPDGAPAVVVRQRLWDRLGFGAAQPGTVDITLDGESYTIVGVLPTDFQDLHYDSDVWFPAAAVSDRGANIIGLRRAGVPVSAVQEEAGGLAERIELAKTAAGSGPGAAAGAGTTSASGPGSATGGTSASGPASATGGTSASGPASATGGTSASGPASTLTAPPARPPNVTSLSEFFTGEIRTRLLVLFAATALVLLIACANVANLLLSRAVGRRREMAVRSALGAGKATLLRQLLTETTVLALTGAVAGWLLATIGVRVALQLAPEYYGFRRLDAVRLDRGVFAFALLVAWGSTLLAGLAPALRTANDAARAAAGWTRASASRGARRSREALMAAEIALALVLLVGTLLLVRTFLVLRPAAPGFHTQDRMVATIGRPAEPAPDDATKAAFARRLIQEVRAAAPGADVAVATDVPLSRSIMNFRVVNVDGEPVAAGDRLVAGRSNLDLVVATPNYFDVLGIPVLRGRGLAATDLPGSPTALVLSESAARRYWGDANPLGRRITLDLGERAPEFVVVGVAGDTRSSGIHTRPRPTAIASFWQVPWEGFELVVHQPRGGRQNRGSRPPAAGLTEEVVRRMVASIDPGVPVGSIAMLDRIAARAVAPARYDTLLMSVFASLAVVLALIGCYGVIGYTIAQRTREIGVRVALGASHGAIVRNVLLRGASIVAIGLVAGTALALAFTRVLEGSLYGVTPTDPTAFAAAVVALALVSLIAVYVPSRRAARVQPVEALRVE